MSLPAPLPRPDQIAELTRGLDLPLAAIDEVFLHIIADGVSQAFKDIRATSPATVAAGDEAEVTALLEARLNRMIEEDQIWRQLVSAVARGKESLNFNGGLLEKRPDLSIFLSARAFRFPLIAEAKIIDSTKGEGLYCSKGVRRFLDGEYGWGGREAFMIAYVRDGSTVASRLKPFLLKSDQAASYAVQDQLVTLSESNCGIARSNHSRSFHYMHTASPANDPGPIALWHLWVDASAPKI